MSSVSFVIGQLLQAFYFLFILSFHSFGHVISYFEILRDLWFVLPLRVWWCVGSEWRHVLHWDVCTLVPLLKEIVGYYKSPPAQTLHCFWHSCCLFLCIFAERKLNYYFCYYNYSSFRLGFVFMYLCCICVLVLKI